MPKKKNGASNGERTRRLWSKEDMRELKAHSKAKSPLAKIAKKMKRTPAALRQQAFKMGLGLGHQR
jgi:hypothetical protein